MCLRQILFSLLLVGALALAGCSSAGERLAEEAAGAAAGGDADIDVNDEGGSFSFEDEEGNTGSFSASGSIPEDWPDDVPLPDEYEIQNSSEIRENDGMGLTVVLNVPQPADELIAFYEEHFESAGWTIASNSNMGDEMYNLMVQDEAENRAVTVGAFVEDEGTTLNVTVLQEG